MPKKILRRGRHNVVPEHLISPLGYDVVERNSYSPAKTVEQSNTGKAGGSASQSESATGQRRGD